MIKQRIVKIYDGNMNNAYIERKVIVNDKIKTIRVCNSNENICHSHCEHRNYSFGRYDCDLDENGGRISSAICRGDRE